MSLWIILISILILIFSLALIAAYIVPDEEEDEIEENRSEKNPILYVIATKEIVGEIEEENVVRPPTEFVDKQETVSEKLLVSGYSQLWTNEPIPVVAFVACRRRRPFHLLHSVSFRFLYQNPKTTRGSSVLSSTHL